MKNRLFGLAFIAIAASLGACAGPTYYAVPTTVASMSSQNTPSAPGKGKFVQDKDGNWYHVTSADAVGPAQAAPSQQYALVPAQQAPVVVITAPFCPSYRTFSLFGTYTPGCPGYGGMPYYYPAYGGANLNLNFRFGGGDHGHHR